MDEAAYHPPGYHRLPAAVMSGPGGGEGHQSGDDQGGRKQALGGPSLRQDAGGYLRAGVAPEEGAEDDMLHRFVPVELLRWRGKTHVPFRSRGRWISVIDTYFEIGICTGRLGHRLQGDRCCHPDRVAAEEAQAHEPHLNVPTSEPCCKEKLYSPGIETLSLKTIRKTIILKKLRFLRPSSRYHRVYPISIM